MEKAAKSKREYLRRLVAEKQRWSEPLSETDKTKGFRGWHERGYLPHCDKPGVIQFVTFRLADSMPSNRRGEWEHFLSIADESEKRRKIEEYLDRGLGDCHLCDPRVADFAGKALLYHHGKRFRLLAWGIMPNHVHALVEIWQMPLAKIVQNWKSIVAVEANRLLGRTGRFWQPDYWDRFMRDAQHTAKAVRYVENNPVKAKLCRAPEEWLFSSARFRDLQTRELKLPPR